MAASNCPETPRQRMISMMYLVLTAMLALNVSVEILNGYERVNDSLHKSIEIADTRNNVLKIQFENLVAQNKEKTQEWKIKADSVAKKSDEFYQYIKTVQATLLAKIDGDNADTASMKLSEGGRGDLNITGEIGVRGGYTGADGRHYPAAGVELRRQMEVYSNYMKNMVADSSKKVSIQNTFSTIDKVKNGEVIKWQDEIFDQMPAVATLTLLTKIQNDIRNTESEVIQYLKDQIDAGDFRVNKIDALVIPNSKTIVRGARYHAQIVLAATDSTRPLEIEVSGRPLEKDGIYELTGNSVGSFKYSGSIVMKKPSGEPVTYKFSDEYVVTEPTATVSADMMNVFYAGIDNPLSVSVPGVAASNVDISVSNATSVRTQKGWNVRPTTIGVESVITVSAKLDGKPTVVAKKGFRVKALPPPLAKVEYKNAQGQMDKYKGGTPIAKNLLITAKGIIAELDDDDLDVKYEVLSFNLKSFDSMGNVLISPATGSDFTQKQLQILRDMVRGKVVYVSDVQSVGPDKRKRTLPPLEISIR